MVGEKRFHFEHTPLLIGNLTETVRKCVCFVDKNTAVSFVVHMFCKGTHMIATHFSDSTAHLRKRYWGQHMWARGYFCATVGVVDEKTIMEYIENQKWDEDAESFKITEPTKP